MDNGWLQRHRGLCGWLRMQLDRQWTWRGLRAGILPCGMGSFSMRCGCIVEEGRRLRCSSLAGGEGLLQKWILFLYVLDCAMRAN